MKKNILLIVVDQMRGDCLGIANHPNVRTPHLDTLAATGVRFENTYTSCPSCIASRAALMTGLSQENHKRVGYCDGIPWNYEHTLASELAKGGYYTQCVGKMHTHPLRNSLGFNNVDLHDGYLHYYRRPETPSFENQNIADDYYHEVKNKMGIDFDISQTGIECNSWVARPFPFEENLHPTNWVTANSIDFLRKRDTSKPFFLMASYVRPHQPFDAPSAYFDMYKDQDITFPLKGDWLEKLGFNQRSNIYNSRFAPKDDKLLKEALIGYYACITHIDHQIGRLLHKLDEDQLTNDTLIIFVSDHGDLLFEHNLFKKSLPYNGCVKIPLIIKGNNIPQNKICNQITELRDILPTILDYADIAIPETIDGKSLLPCINNENINAHNFIHGEHSDYEYPNHFIVNEEYKYIWYSKTGIEQFFDIKNDKNELHDLIDDTNLENKISKLRNILIDVLKDREEGYSDGTKLIIGKQSISYLTK